MPRRAHLLLNCLIVAAWLFVASHGRNSIWVKRSEGKRGRIPHMGVMRERGRELTVVDYIPRKRKSSMFDRGQCFVLFDGLFRVRRYRLMGVGTGDTLSEAYRAVVARER